MTGCSPMGNTSMDVEHGQVLSSYFGVSGSWERRAHRGHKEAAGWWRRCGARDRLPDCQGVCIGVCPKGIDVPESFYPLWGIGGLEGVT